MRTVCPTMPACPRPLCLDAMHGRHGVHSHVGVAREKLERNACSTLLIIDVQSVKNTDTAIHKGYDAGKKVSGIKRHIALDTLGLPHAVAVTTADVTDRKGALGALVRCKPALGRIQSVLCDSGYTGQPFE